MFNILFTRTFLIVGGMLLITALTARTNKAFETGKELWATVIGTFAFLFAVIFFADSFPVNLVLVAIFAALIGCEIGPTIEFYGKRVKLRKLLKSQGNILKKGQYITQKQQKEYKIAMQEIGTDPNAPEWHNIVFQAIFGTAIAVIATGAIVFLTSIDFSFLGGFLFIALLILIVM